MIDKDLTDLIDRMLNGSGLISNIRAAEGMNGGKNNRLYKLTLQDGKKYVLKRYFKHINDPRNRQKTESLFYEYAEKIKIINISKLIYADSMANASLFEYVDGIKISPSLVSKEDIQMAIEFVNNLNFSLHKFESKNLPIASEACFSINDHLELINSRVTRLYEIKNQYSNEILTKIIEEILTCWKKIRQDIVLKVNAEGLNIYSQLLFDDKCISPSDFGFHNAIKKADGSVIFIDFEYAGWDDPAKLVGDFFAQIEVPIPENYVHVFIDSVASNYSNQKEFKFRANLLMPAYQIKWCCIALNFLIPENLERRIFSNASISANDYLHGQLQKAKLILGKLNKNYELH